MFVKVNSTRDTSAGMFRAGLVYGISDKNHRALAAIKPHLVKDGPMVKLTKAQAEKAQAEAIMLLAPGEAAEAEKAAADKTGEGDK